MSHWQTVLVNVTKGLFSWKTIEFGYIKCELEGGGIVLCIQEGGCNFFQVANQIFPTSPSVLNDCSLIYIQNQKTIHNHMRTMYSVLHQFVTQNSVWFDCPGYLIRSTHYIHFWYTPSTLRCIRTTDWCMY